MNGVTLVQLYGMARYRNFIAVLFLFFALRVNAEWKQGLVFTENRGQVRTIGDRAAAHVYFMLSSGTADYYFTDKGYAAVQKGDSGKTNTTRFDFDEEIMY